MSVQNTYLNNVAVIGAGGKMGSGIALLLLQEMVLGAKEGQDFPILTLIDSNEKTIYSLKGYLRAQLPKFAEKNIVRLREIYKNNSNLVSNEEMIRHFVDRALDSINCSISLDSAKHATLIFEAIAEKAALKIELYKSLKKYCGEETLFFTNTSSIPISYLNEQAALNDHIIGYHFYNPPAIQKLLEIIPLEKVNSRLLAVANDLASRLKKTVVISRDIAGFIGNGHFIPEGFFACREAELLAAKQPLREAVYLINMLSQDFLIRPMGIFQLIDYVGIDIFQNIALIMREHLKDDTLWHSLIDAMVAKGVVGGQHADGSQKPGFFAYEGTKICGAYDFADETYHPLEKGGWNDSCRQELGPLPQGHSPWKKLVNDRQQEEKLRNYFDHLSTGTALGELLAMKYLGNSCAIARKLVANHVAKSLREVSTVLKTGFFHLYGPDASWMPHNETGSQR